MSEQENGAAAVPPPEKDEAIHIGDNDSECTSQVVDFKHILEVERRRFTPHDIRSRWIRAFVEESEDVLGFDIKQVQKIARPPQGTTNRKQGTYTPWLSHDARESVRNAGIGNMFASFIDGALEGTAFRLLELKFVKAKLMEGELTKPTYQDVVDADLNYGKRQRTDAKPRRSKKPTISEAAKNADNKKTMTDDENHDVADLTC